MTAARSTPRFGAGDPDAPAWLYADVAACLGLSVDTVRRRMPDWRRSHPPFPAPLPWSRRELRWHPAAVIRWKGEVERAAKAVPPPAPAVVGGRDRL